MLSHLSRFLVIPAVMALCLSCAETHQPFAVSEDAALKQHLTEALGPRYTRTMHITVSGGRVYMEGELQNKAELDDARSIIKETPGVTSVMEHVFLTEVGPEGGRDDTADRR